MGTRVLYITGWLRSGTTILGNVLNELPGVCHVGELHYLWKNGLLKAGTNSLCGCGATVRECPMWSSVLASVDVAAPADMMAWQHGWLRTRHTRARLADRAAPPDAVRRATDQLAAIYRAVAERGGGRTVVDSSKYPAEAAALLGRDDLDVRVLHVVRDPRAVSHSYRRGKQYIAPMGPAESTAHWLGFNAASERVGAAAGHRYLRVRHEDLVGAPRATLVRVMAFAGLDGECPVDAHGVVHLGVNHTVTGNPDRLHQGAVTIRGDDRWRTGLDGRAYAVTNAIALPMLRHYGYALGRQER